MQHRPVEIFVVVVVVVVVGVNGSMLRSFSTRHLMTIFCGGCGP